MSTRRAAFTLIEISAVIVLAALLAAALALSLSGVGRAARMEDAIQQIIAFDDMTRRTARASGRAMEIVVDTEAQRIRRIDATTRQVHGRQLALGSRVRIDEARLGGGALMPASAPILVSDRGLSSTYALKLTEGSAKRWVLIVGLTGRGIEVSDDGEVQQLLRTTATRDDAD